ncbi:MAG: protein TolR [Deltaproteobacteria bacterium]|nr:protein TolR [Deltaproteobacteria bacterium]
MAAGRDNGHFMSDINVTPLVDVMLVLLIIFMITAPMMMQGVNVSLPQTTSRPLPAEKDHLVITVDSNQQIYINDYKVTLDALHAKLKKIFEGRPDQKVYLRADKKVPYGFVVRVISEAKNAGVDKLGVVTEPLKEGRTKS